MVTKNEVREKFLQKRAAVPQERREAAAQFALQFLCQWIEDFFPDPNSKIVSFASYGDEIDLWPLNRWLLKNRTLCLPKVTGENLQIYEVEDSKTLQPNKYGILEPTEDPSKEVLKELVEVIVVPGTSFDNEMHRLGYGKGYYDRLLDQIPKKAPKIGVGFKEQLSKEPFPSESHDHLLTHRFLF